MILISPFSKKMRSDKPNPKNFPYWKELATELSKISSVIQIGIDGEEQLVQDFRKNLLLRDICELVKECDVWISVDNFLQHLVNAKKIEKRGIVIWSLSDPRIFGYKANKNVFKNKKFFRERQFETWEQAEFNENAFLKSDDVLSVVKNILEEID